MSFCSFFLLLFHLGCQDETKVDPPKKTDTAVQETKKPKFSLDLSKLDTKLIQEIALVPSPAEMQKALSKSGLQAQLGTLAMQSKSIDMNSENNEQIAVRCGVVLAELALTVKVSPDERLIANLKLLKDGFTKLGAGKKFLKTIDEMSSAIQTKVKSRDDLLRDMDQLAGIMVPELKKELGEWVVPLIQAGSWLKGANLVSSAIEQENKYDVATRLLKQPHVIDYFLKYVKTEGAGKAPDEVIQQLQKTLKELQNISQKTSLSKDDVLSIKSNTASVLQFL